MPEVYTLRAPENFNYTNNGRLSSTKVQNYDRKPLMYHLKSNEGKITPTNNLLKPSPSPIYGHSNHRMTPVSANTKRKSPILHRQKPKSNDILIHSNSPSPKKVTTYMIRATNELPHISRTPSPPIHSTTKKQLVTFDTTNHYDKYDILNQQRHVTREISYIPLSKSKATESIHRSMNMFRFRRN